MPQIIAFVFGIGLRIILQYALDYSFAFKVGINGKIGGISDSVRIVSEHARAHGVKRTRPNALRADVSFDTLFHLVCGFVCESDCQNVIRVDARLDEMANPSGKHASFSAPRARNNQNCAFGVVDGGKLLWIEIEVVHSVIIQPFMRVFVATNYV